MLLCFVAIDVLVIVVFVVHIGIVISVVAIVFVVVVIVVVSVFVLISFGRLHVVEASSWLQCKHLQLKTHSTQWILSRPCVLSLKRFLS